MKMKIKRKFKINCKTKKQMKLIVKSILTLVSDSDILFSEEY